MPKLDPDIERAAQAARNTYQSSGFGCIPEWSEIHESTRASWRAVARAVVVAHRSPDGPSENAD